MSPSKIISPLDELVGYLVKAPVIVEPYPGIPLTVVITEIKTMGGKTRGVFFENTLRAQFRLDVVKKLSAWKNIRRVMFDGDYRLLKGGVTRPDNKLDKYLVELLSFLEATSIIVQTIDGLNEIDVAQIEQLGGHVKDDLRIIYSYSATLPLAKIEAVAESPRITSIWYDQPVFGFYKHGGTGQ